MIESKGKINVSECSAYGDGHGIKNKVSFDAPNN